MGCHEESISRPKEDSPDEEEEEEEVAEKQTTIDFKSVVQNVLRTYRPEQAKDLSTSFCFIVCYILPTNMDWLFKVMKLIII